MINYVNLESLVRPFSNENYSPLFICSREIDLTPRIKEVIFHAPATIVYWEDGDKTVVKCTECRNCATRSACNESYAWRESGLRHAMLKRIFGSGYLDTLREWCEDVESE